MAGSRTLALLCVGYLLSLSAVHAQTCPNSCSDNGFCDTPDLRCQCFAGFTGGDCSERKCPTGPAWIDTAIGIDDAHHLAECSNMGVCNRNLGTCTCNVGYIGQACGKTECSKSCSSHGVCKSMRHYAQTVEKLVDPGTTVYKYATPWDANMVHGCDCDQGYTGYDCSYRECPVGDDPLTTGQLDEVQLFTCDASNGTFTLTFGDYNSEPISVSATTVQLSDALNAMHSIGQVSVTFAESAPVCTLISSGITQVVTVTFLQNFGQTRHLYMSSTHSTVCAGSGYTSCGGGGITFARNGGALLSHPSAANPVSQTGTKENDQCSGRGLCSTITGTCTCYPGYDTSDGRGLEGVRGDCGRALAEVTRCPGEIACSGHGYCQNSPTFKCVCANGWTSGDCSIRTCQSGFAWFDLPIAENRAHGLAVCSNNGLCDEITGECSCQLGFEGAACEFSTCPGSIPCSGNGRCLAMELLAQEATTNGVHTPFSYGNTVVNDPLHWDYNKLQGCLCDDGFTGYDCSQRVCPVGDDPDTTALTGTPQNDEMQSIVCVADGGSFAIRFRIQETTALAFDATAATVQAAIEALSSVTSAVSVVYTSGTDFCNLAGSNTVTVTFLHDFGNLPALEFLINEGSTILTASAGSVSLDVAENGVMLGGVTSVAGSKENEVCSNRGVCDLVTGVCGCFLGYGSSNGRNEVGARGDCGWKMSTYSIEG